MTCACVENKDGTVILQACRLHEAWANEHPGHLVDQLREAMREHEWGYAIYGDYPSCPWCGGLATKNAAMFPNTKAGHASDCVFVALTGQVRPESTDATR